MIAFARAYARKALLLAGFGLLAHAAAAQTNIVGNAGFETPVISDGSTKINPGTGLAPWTVLDDPIKLRRSTSGAPEGRQWIDLTDDGKISQTLATLPGKSYKLSFKYSTQIGSTPRVTVKWGPVGSPTFTETFTISADKGWVTTERTVQATSASTVLSFTPAGGNNNFGVQIDDVRATALISLATPSLVRVVATQGTDGYLFGRVDGAANTPISLQITAASVCTNGVLAAPVTTVGAPIALTTDKDGYFQTPFSGVAAGNFVAVKVTAPVSTATSGCLASSGDNDAWPKALNVIDSSPTARDYIDSPGKARWYKFKILPGQRVTVTLSGLPADYDLAVFKDIGAAFLAQVTPTKPADLTKLSAEYAPSVFSPSVFSPSVFSPSVFSPDAYAPSVFSPSVFSPSVFSPSVFSPSVFSPSVFSPSVFSPSVFSPSVFSPSVFSPSVFSPSVFSPSVFSPTEIAQAFSSAQTRSIIGVAATPGTGDESVVVNTWNNTGDFYVRVSGRAGAYTTGGQFTVGIAKSGVSCANVNDSTLTSRSAAAGAGVRTVILTDSSKVALDADLGGGSTLRGKLTAFAARAEIGGVIVDVGTDTRVNTLKVQAANNAACPYATNLVAEEIKGIVDSYRPNNPELKYVVIAGNDEAIPFFRYPDQSLLGQESGYVPPVRSDSASEASLRTDHVLSQDAYGSGTRVSLRTSGFPVPGLAVGRLVETPGEMAGLIDAYTATGGVVTPGTSFVSGYDFLEDAANAVKGELSDGGTTVRTLITPNGKSPEDPASWTATQLGDALFGTRHDLVFLAGHFSANSALAADFKTSLITTDLAASTANFTNSIVFSAGCHSGYNLVDAAAIEGVTLKLDWVQAFAQKKATLIAGTGYQYGDTDFLEYSERLYNNFARQLRAGEPGTAVAVGEALVKAKLDYLAVTPDIRGIHEKALLEATLFGLPMLGVNMPAGRGAISGPPGAITPVAASWPASASASLLSLGLMTSDLDVAPALTPKELPLTGVGDGSSNVLAKWWEGPQGVVTNPAEPALPIAGYNVTPTNGNLVLRGVGFRGGAYTDDVVTPLTGAPTTELRGVHVPFVSPVFFPMRPWTVNYFGSLGGNGATSLLVTPAQHRAADIALGTSARRTFNNLNLRLFYSGNLSQAALSDAPSIVAVDAQPDGGGVAFTARVVGDPAAAVYQVWVTYTGDGIGTWTSLDLAQCVAPLPSTCAAEDSQVWKGRLATLPANIRYIIQAANGYGLVTLDDKLGAYHGLGGAAQAATAVLLDPVAPASASFGGSASITATLQSAGTPLASRNVIVGIGGAARAGMTDANGKVTVKVPLVSVPGTYQVVASFGGDANYLPSSASGGSYVVGKAVTSIAALSLTTVGATLTASTGGAAPQPLLQETVKFTVTPAAGSPVLKEIYVITDYVGRAPLPPTGLAAGSYKVTASFAGNATYTAASSTQDLTIAAQGINIGGAGLPDSITFPGSTKFTVTSTSGQPVTVALEPNPSPYCTLTSMPVTGGTEYTLTAVAAGLCRVVLTAGATTTYAEVLVTKDIAIKFGQVISFGTLASRTFGDPPFTVAATGGASGNPVTFSSTTPPVCTVSGTTVTIIAAGSCTIAADQAGAEFYNAAPQVTQSFTVNKAAQTISFGALAPLTFGASPFAVSATSSSGLPVSFAASGSCTVAGNLVTITGAGSCTITASQAGDGNYLPAPSVPQTFAIAPAAQTITWPTIPAKTYAPGGTFGLTATATGGGTVTFTSLSTGVCTVAGTAATIVTAGDCIIRADQPGAPNYVAATTQQTIAIGKAAQTISFVPISPPTFVAGGAGTFAVSATATSSLTVAFSSSTPLVCTVSGTTVTMKSAGVCTINADQAGGTNYLAAPQVVQSVTIGKAAQTITFAGPGDRTYPSAPIPLTATSTSGLSVTFAATGNCTVSGSTLTLTAAGSCTITASQAGDTNFAAATPAVRTIAIAASDLANVWTLLTAKMTKPRLYHTATRFESGPLAGQVLIVGGRDRTDQPLASSELYNPVTRTFVAAGNLSSKSSGHTATLLVNGKVVVFGGGNASVQAFDPATKTWTSAGSLSSSRSWHTATLLLDGRVLVIGGADNSGNTLGSTIVYNPTAGTFANGPVLDTPREHHTATLLPNGKVLVVGGRRKSSGSYVTHATYQICDATACTASVGGIAARHSHAAVTLWPDGTKVLVAGGANGNTDLATADVYNTVTGTWSTTGTGVLSLARRDLTLSELPNGRALAAGGSKAGYAEQESDVFGPPFASMASMKVPRAGHTATPLEDAAGNITGILVTGGANDDADADDALDSAEIYGTP